MSEKAAAPVDQEGAATVVTAPAQATPVADPKPDTPDYERIDALRQQGMTTNFPGVSESLLQDRGGWRTRLADKGVYVRGQMINSLITDIRGKSRSVSPQVFSGQKPTLSSANFVSASFALDGLGLENAQITAGAEIGLTTWAPGGPTQFQLTLLEYYQSFFDRTIEVKAGFNPNITNFVGVFAGGNPILSSGLGGLIPVQVGLSASPGNTPTLNVTLNGKRGLYNKVGIQRSISSRGLIYEAQNNGIGIRFAQKDARVLLIDEVGILREAKSDQRQMWLRAGVMYNTTRYERFEGGSARNHAFYALGDYQLIRTDPALPHRGLFIGASALFAPQDVNVFNRSFELRSYLVGVTEKRPGDTITFTLGYNGFSEKARAVNQLAGVRSPGSQFQASILYAARMRAGVYVVPSLAYLRNPSFAGPYPDAVNGSLTVSMLF